MKGAEGEDVEGVELDAEEGGVVAVEKRDELLMEWWEIWDGRRICGEVSNDGSIRRWVAIRWIVRGTATLSVGKLAVEEEGKAGGDLRGSEYSRFIV